MMECVTGRSLALAVLGLAACGHGGRWVESRSANVTVYTEAKLEHEYMQEWLELSHAAYSAFFPEVRLDKIDVVWLRTEPGEGTRFNRPNDDPAFGWTLETVPSRGPIGKDGLIVLERREDYRAGPGGFAASSVRDETLAKRQMAHLFILKAAGTAPLWLHVGLARYLAKYRIHYRGKAWVACFGGAAFDEPPEVAGRGGRRVVVPVAELFGTDWYEYDRGRRYWYEYTAYALVHYLIHGENGFHRTRFPVLMRALREGKDTEEALAIAYPNVLPDEWDERLGRHVRPPAGRARIAATPELAQGVCHRIPPAHHAQMKPRRRAADQQAVATLIEDLERVDVFRRHSAWFPQDVVEAEAAKRPPRRGRGGTGTGSGTGGEGTGGAGDHPRQDDKTPTIRVPVPGAPPR